MSKFHQYIFQCILAMLIVTIFIGHIDLFSLGSVALITAILVLAQKDEW